MTDTTYQKTEEGDLPESYEDATFATHAAPVAVEVVEEETTLVNTGLADMVREICRSHENAEKMREAVITAACAALLEHLNLGLQLQRLTQQAAGQIAVAALYSDYKGNPKAREIAVKICGGQSIPFTYATGRKCVNLYLDMKQRMVAGGMNEAEARRILGDHAARLAAGDYGDPLLASENLYSPYLTATTLRQAYLELAPAKPAPTPGEVLDEAAAAAPAPATWQEQRVKLLADFGGMFDTLATYVTQHASYISTADREQLADRLEEEAKRLRAMKTQGDIPGLIPDHQ